jgi:glycosyltransferase involved in cell wall biosynthesis
LLDAMRGVPPHGVLWVAGARLPSDHGEGMEPHLVRAAAALGRRLVRLGHRDDMPRVMAAADVFCLPSHFEGLPMSIVEAMLTGLPVVATDIRGSREQVVDGETGLLVPPATVAPLAAALARLAGDPALRAAMGEAGRARALGRFDEAQVLARTVALLEATPAATP